MKTTNMLNIDQSLVILIAKYLSRSEICAVSNTCRNFNNTWAHDYIWKPLVLKFVAVKVWENRKNNFEAVWREPFTNDILIDECYQLFKTHNAVFYSDCVEQGWKKGLMIYARPPAIPSESCESSDVLVGLTTLIQILDSITDLIILYFYGTSTTAKGNTNTYVGISVTFIVFPLCVIGLFDGIIVKEIKPYMCILNILQMRVLVECIRYYRIRYSRMKLTGKYIDMDPGMDKDKKKAALTVGKLKLFKAVFQSLPQAVLQTFVQVYEDDFDIIPIISIVLSILSVSLAFVSMLNDNQVNSRGFPIWFPPAVFFFTASGLFVRIFGYAFFMMISWEIVVSVIAVVFLLNMPILWWWGSAPPETIGELIIIYPICSIALLLSPMVYKQWNYNGDIRVGSFNILLHTVNALPPTVLSIIFFYINNDNVDYTVLIAFVISMIALNNILLVIFLVNRLTIMDFRN